jgi:mono/diheme cytochrome c family protein
MSAAALLVAAACGDRPGGPPRGFDPGPVPAELAAGERVFNAGCARCHGLYGVGTDLGPPLVHIYYEPNHHADEAFRRAVRSGVQPHHWNFGAMQPVEGLDDSAVAAVTAYIRWLQRQGGIY